MSNAKVAVRANLKKPSELWPGGLSHFFLELQTRGFKPEFFQSQRGQLVEAKLTQLPQSDWAQLTLPASFESKSSSTAHYAFWNGAKVPKGEISGAIGLLFVPDKIASLPPLDAWVIRTPYPEAAFDVWLRHLAVPEWNAGKTADPEKFGSKVHIESHCVIAEDVEIGEGTVVETGVRIGARVKIGKNCRLGANSRIGDDTIMGEGCRLTASVSIGGQGFGLVQYPGVDYRQPRLHVGRVVLGNAVRLGASVTVDRGVIDDTIIGSHCSFDNLVHVGHNCTVGDAGIVCGFVGLSGSTKVGHHVTIAGMVGTKGHMKIGDHVTIAAQSGVTRDLEDGETVKGYPVRPLKEALEISALVDKLPDIYQRLRKIEKGLKEPK